MLQYSLSQFLIKMKITATIIYSEKKVLINPINMLYYDRIDVSEGIDINKASVSKQCGICHYQYFLGKGFKFAICLQRVS